MKGENGSMPKRGTYSNQAHTGYALTRKIFDFADNERDCKCFHIALFLFIVDLNNKLNWISEFGLPTDRTMHCLSIGNRNTYIKLLEDLTKWGFIEQVEPPKNQYQARIIKICPINNEQALNKHKVRHCTSTVQGTELINKPIKLNKPIKREGFAPPTLIEFENYFTVNGYSKEVAHRAYNGYSVAEWKDSRGKQINNWKQKAHHVWFKPEHKKEVLNESVKKVTDLNKLSYE